jgi:hypothetical protein
MPIEDGWVSLQDDSSWGSLSPLHFEDKAFIQDSKRRRCVQINRRLDCVHKVMATADLEQLVSPFTTMRIAGSK